MPQSRVWKHLVYKNLPKALTDIEQYERKRPRQHTACPQAASFLLFRGPGWDGGIQKNYSQLPSTERILLNLVIAHLQLIIINCQHTDRYGIVQYTSHCIRIQHIYTCIYSALIALHVAIYVLLFYWRNALYVIWFICNDIVFRRASKPNLQIEAPMSSIKLHAVRCPV